MPLISFPINKQKYVKGDKNIIILEKIHDHLVNIKKLSVSPQILD